MLYDRSGGEWWWKVVPYDHWSKVFWNWETEESTADPPVRPGTKKPTFYPCNKDTATRQTGRQVPHMIEKGKKTKKKTHTTFPGSKIEELYICGQRLFSATLALRGKAVECCILSIWRTSVMYQPLLTLPSVSWANKKYSSLPSVLNWLNLVLSPFFT